MPDQRGPDLPQQNIMPDRVKLDARCIQQFFLLVADDVLNFADPVGLVVRVIAQRFENEPRIFVLLKTRPDHFFTHFGRKWVFDIRRTLCRPEYHQRHFAKLEGLPNQL